MKTTHDKVWMEEGLDLWQGAATALNEEILQGGQLQKNNRRIWDTILHNWNNYDYVRVIALMRLLMETNPEMFAGRNEEAVLTADMILGKHWDRPTGKKNPTWGPDGRVLDQPEFKHDAWKLIMAMREVWNKAQGIDIPNDDTSKTKTTNKPNLFDTQ